MSEKTDAEWHALDARIAQEVMEWEAKPYGGTLIYSVPKQVNKARYIRIEDWQPHKAVAQAMAALHAVLTKTGRHVTADLAIRPPPGCCRVIIHDWSRDEEILGERMSDEKYAICSALEKFMEANC